MEGTVSSPWVAIGPRADRGRHARRLAGLHAAFHSGDDIGGQVRDVVAGSWERSSAAGIDPDGHRAPVVLSPEATEARWRRHPLHGTLPALRDLLSEATRESDHVLVISDADGVLLWMEGHQAVVDATEAMGFVPGADWSEAAAGTNALGLALAVDHSVQIFSAEHFAANVHPWQCSGAPVHDPETGALIGVVDLTGHFRTAHPHTLALVTAAAGVAEAHLRSAALARRERLRDRYRERVGDGRDQTALVTAHGHVLEGSWLDWPLGAPPAGGEIELPDGTSLVAEPFEEGAYVLRKRARSVRTASLRLEFLRPHPRALVDGRPVLLGRRQAELLAVLALAPTGLSAEQLALELYGEAGKPVTARAEIARIKRMLGSVITARPYTLVAPHTADFLEAEGLVDAGVGAGVGEALALHAEPLLRTSEVPAVSEARASLELVLRRAVMHSMDPDLLDVWCRSTAGRDDVGAAERLLELIDDDHPLCARARAHAERLRQL